MGGFRDGSVIRCKLDADIHINSIENSWSLHCGVGSEIGGGNVV